MARTHRMDDAPMPFAPHGTDGAPEHQHAHRREPDGRTGGPGECRAAQQHPDDPCCHHEHDDPAALSPLAPATLLGNGDTRTQLRIQQMDCPTEEALIRKALAALPAVHDLEFNLMQRVLTVIHTPESLDRVLHTIRELGFTPEQAGAATEMPAAKPWWPLALSAAAALAAEAAQWMGSPWLLPALLAAAAVLASGTGTYRKGWTALRHGQMNINALMSIAVTGAFLLGQWAEAAMVMVLYTLAERIEARSLDRARHAVHGLMRLAPERARIRQPDGAWLEIDAAAAVIGDIARARPGERIALDGVVASGHSSLDQAPITGESLPVEKGPGDPLYAGTINGSGTLEYRVTSTAGESTLARIIRAIEQAQSARAPTQQFVDRFARVYTPAVVLTAAALACVPPLLNLGGWYEWVYKALVLLVIACPCALVISTPVSIVSGLARAARHGILVKGGIYLEQGRTLRWLALDKTGTITHGRPTLTHAEALAAAPPSEDWNIFAAALAASSDHPVSQAIHQGLSHADLPAVDSFHALPGRGGQGVIAGQAYVLGNHRLIHERGLCGPKLESRLEALEREGQTVVMLANDQQVLALYAVADTVKPESAEAIAGLHDLGIRTLMLSGDNAHTVSAIARQCGVDQAQGELLPEDKLAAVAQLVDQGHATGMVGDGINDAPALARADVGFSMGAIGSDAAIETADIALMDDDLRKIPWFIRLSRATHRILVQNIVIALAIKAVFLVLTVLGLGTMWMAVFADVGASLIVVFNGLRLLRHERTPAEADAEMAPA